jgi:hypothetical protein
VAFPFVVDVGEMASVGGSVALADTSLGAICVGDPVGIVELELGRILG